MKQPHLPSTAFAAACFLSLLATPAAALDNAGFEVPDQGATGFIYTPGGADWTFSASAGLSGPNGPWKCNSVSPDPLGDQFAYLQRAASISQDLTGLVVGATYELNFFESYRTGQQSSNDLSVIIDEGLGAEVTIYNNPNVINPTWEARTTSWFVASATTHTLTFRATDPLGTGDRTTIIDGVTVTTVALPGPPLVDTLSPADGAIDLSPNTQLVMTFDRIIEIGTGDITIKIHGGAAETVYAVTDPEVSVSATALTITPSAPLSWSTHYAIRMDAGVVTDSLGNAFAGIGDDDTWDFTIADPDLTPPGVLTQSPAADATGVTRQAGLSMTFDENVVKGTGNLVIKRVSDESVVGTIDVNDAAVVVTGAVVSLASFGGLDRNTEYYVEIDSGAFEDIFGNDFAGISGSTAWSFTTSKVYYVPITGDADSGISSGKTYTHAIDFGDNGARPVATVNGVVFVDGGIGAFPGIAGGSHTVGSGSTNFGSSHPGNDFAAPHLDGGSAAAIENLVGDMIYNPASGQVITLTGLTPETPYVFRLYNRPWGIGTRTQDIGFDIDAPGPATSIADAEDTGVFSEDNSTLPDPGLAEATQVNALSFPYTLPPGQTTLHVYINAQGAGSYHMYGMTNEVAIAPQIVPVTPANGEVDASRSILIANFDQPIVKGTGNITIRLTSDDTAVDVIPVNSANVVIDGTRLTIRPNSLLAGMTGFYVEIDNGALEDESGNALAGISGNSTWAFTTTAIDFYPITGDADSEVYLGREYTHAIDFGDNTGGNAVATVNGVVFANGGIGDFPDPAGSSQTVGTGTSTMPNSNPGNAAADPFLTAGGTQDLVGDMIFNNLNARIDLTGLTPGVAYRVRLYNRAWELGFNRKQDIGFNTDGVAGAEATASFNEDNATNPDPAFPTVGQVYAVSYDYVLPGGVTTLSINIDRPVYGTGSYHLYGLTNEALDSDAPLVTDYNPADESGSVPTYSDLVLTFDDEMLVGTGNITIRDLGPGPDIVIPVGDPQVTVAGNTLTINLTGNLVGSNNYAVQIDAGAVTDTSFNDYAGIADDTTWNFTTAPLDVVAPDTLSFVPADDAIDAEPADDLVITFDEDVMKGSGNIVIKESGSGTVIETIDVASPEVSVSGADVTINPTANPNLSSNGSYYVEVDPGAIEDLTGNDFAGLAGDMAWNFSTRDALVLRLEAVNYDELTGVWTDTSGLANDALAAVAPNRPARVAAVASNGTSMPVARFDGDDYLDLTTGIRPLSPADGYTAFVYLRPESDVAVGKTMIGGDVASFQYRLKGVLQNVVRQQQQETGVSDTALPFGAGALFSNINVQVNDIGGFFRLDGVDDGTLIGSSYSGATNKIGTRNPITESYAGDIAEIRLYDRQLSLAEVQAIEAELDAAYAPTLYGTWAAGFLPDDVADPAGNNESDSLNNLLEFAFGTNPLVSTGPLTWDGVNPAVPGTPVVDLSYPVEGGVDYKARFMRRKDHDQPGSVHYTLEFSADLTDWETSDDVPWPIADPVYLADDASGDYELVEIPYPLGLPVSGKKARFFRVTVTAL